MIFHIYARTNNFIFKRWVYTGEWWTTYKFAHKEAKEIERLTGKKTKLVPVIQTKHINMMIRRI